MPKSKARFMLFSIGAVGYGLLEVLWRGYTHWSMLTAGGICFMFFSRISERMKNAGILLKAIVGSGFITLIEFIFGVIFNIILKKNVWDYSKLPFNIAGQVCLLYSFFWGIISAVCIPFAGLVRKRLISGAKASPIK